MLLEGKKGLILGVANKQSIARAIAESAAREGARLIFNYQNDRFKDKVEKLAEGLEGSKTFQCDVGPRGVRVNAISAGPIRTLAARGVGGISKMVEHHREIAPLRHATEQAEVGDTALFLLSSLGRGITGEVIYVDGGYHILGTLA